MPKQAKAKPARAQRIDQAFLQRKSTTAARDAAKPRRSPRRPGKAEAAPAGGAEAKGAEKEEAGEEEIKLPAVDRAGMLGWKEVPDAEVLLRRFDLDSKYGPSVGLTRLARWQRAERNGLAPPAYVRQLVESGRCEASSVLDAHLALIGRDP